MFGASAYALMVAATLGGLQQAFIEAAPECPAPARWCFGVELFVVLEDGAPVQSPTWFAGELAHANALFAGIDVGFELAQVRFLEAVWAHVPDREHRDRLGRRLRTPGLLHTFMVRRLDDVDIEDNQLFGVHWRDRANVERRWVIVSARDFSSTVLSHEYGHYFGLPHGSHRDSVMNKKPRLVPTWPDRIFVSAEREKMARKRDEMVADGVLVPRGGD